MRIPTLWFLFRLKDAPKIYIRNQLIGAYVGKSLTLECETEAYPKPIYYWTLSNGQLLTDGEFLSRYIEN